MRRCAVLVALMSVLPAWAEMAYVPNEKSATLSVIDTARDSVVYTVPVGQRPRGIAVGAHHVYLTDGKSGSLLIVDRKRGDTLDTLRLGDSPEGVSLSPDGKLLAVAIEDDNAVHLVSTVNRREVAKIKVAGKNPEHAVFSPDGRWLYVSAEEAEQVDVIDLRTRR